VSERVNYLLKATRCFQ